ncbi:hypothetical protein ACWDWV_05170 [Streptosporangium sandarakinum]
MAREQITGSEQEHLAGLRDRFLYPGERSFQSRQGTRKIRITVDLEEADYRTLKDLTDHLAMLSGNPVLSHAAVWREMLRLTAENTVLHPALVMRLRPLTEGPPTADT